MPLMRGGEVKRLRTEADMTQEELATFAKITRSTVASIETDRRSVSWVTVRKIAHALNLRSVDSLVTADD